MVRNLKLKAHEIPSGKKPSSSSKKAVKLSGSKLKTQEFTKRKKDSNSAMKIGKLNSFKLKTCVTSPDKKLGKTKSNTVPKSLKLKTNQRNPVAFSKLEGKNVKAVDWKSLKKSEGKKGNLLQKNLSNKCSKVITKSKSLKIESCNVSKKAKDSRPNKKSTASRSCMPNCRSKSQPSTKTGKGLSVGISDSKNHAEDTPVDNTNKIVVNIEQTILDMQNKILKLEQKSVLDDEKLNIFKMLMLKQRNDNIKMLMDEKENELLLRMDLLYVDYEPERVCKLCLQLFDKKESLMSLVTDQTIVSLVNSTLNMEIELNDGTPTGLCDDCLLQIQRYDWMKRRSQRANILSKRFIAMKKGLNECAFTFDTATSDMFLSEHTLDEDITEEDQLIDHIKIEDAFSLDSHSNVRAPLDLTFIKEETESDDDRLCRSVLPESNQSHLSSKTCRRCHSTFTNHWTLNKHYKYCCQRFKCLECRKCFFSNRLFRLHKLRRQSCVSTSVFRYCVVCNTSFRWRWQLVFHVLKHKQENDWKIHL